MPTLSANAAAGGVGGSGLEPVDAWPDPARGEHHPGGGELAARRQQPGADSVEHRGAAEAVRPAVAPDADQVAAVGDQILGADRAEQGEHLLVLVREQVGAGVHQVPLALDGGHPPADGLLGLKHGEHRTCLLELPGGGEPGDAGADDDHPGAVDAFCLRVHRAPIELVVVSG